LTILRIDGGVLRRGGREVLRDLTLQVGYGKVVALLGANGSGKSSLLLAVAGELTLSAGDLWLFGTRVTDGESWNRARAGVSLVPQTDYLYDDLTVRENLRIATAYTDRSDMAARRATAEGLWAKRLPMVRLDTLASHLSTGEARFLSILCGLARRSRLLMVDEPSAGLSEPMASTVFDLLRRAATAESSVIIAEQRRDLAAGVADTMVVLNHGGIAWQGAGP